MLNWQDMSPRTGLLTILALALVVSACGGGGNQDLSGSSTPEPSAPSASESPTNLDHADRLYYEGRFEDAIKIYTQIAQAKGNQSDEALWTLARVQYERGDNAAAEAAAERLAEAESVEMRRLALLLLGSARFARGDNAAAEEAFGRYVESAGPATAYARLRLADLASRRGDTDQAATLIDEALGESLPPAAATDARFARAAYLEDAGDSTNAIALYESEVTFAPTDYLKGEALWLAADLAYGVGETARAEGFISRLVTIYPWHDRALESLGHPAATEVLTVRERALVLFRHRLNELAADAFTSILAYAGPDEAAEVHYHLGILAERAEDYERALAEYDAALASGGGEDTLLAQTLWDRATVVERLGSVEDAAEAFVAGADRFPYSVNAPEALFRAGFLRFQQGATAEALGLWRRYTAIASDPESQARAYFWTGKAAQKAGDDRAAVESFAIAAEVAPLDYYGLRARGESDRATPLEMARPLTTAAWLNDWAGAEPVAVREAFFAETGWRRARELSRAGLVADAEAEFTHLTDLAQSSSPWLLYRAAQRLSEEGHTQLAARAAVRSAQSHANPPPALLALAYPPAYLDLATGEADENGFPPILLLALVRQESYYEPRAVSPADASGLTQVIPGTAGDIAAALGEADFRQSDLFRPNVSLRFGAYYLGEQLKFFDGRLHAALAAYNGGPGNAQRWEETSGSDPDVFLETIDLSETRAYVELVSEHYAAYRYAYGAARLPSLPEP